MNSKFESSYMRYLQLPVPKSKTLVTYIWIDSTGIDLRSKTRTLDYVPQTAEDCPMWNFDGSSTGQAIGVNSDCLLKPVALFKDPFLCYPNADYVGENNKLVLCEVYSADNTPATTNHRHACLKVMEKAIEHEPWFGIEQEYLIKDSAGHPYKWPRGGPKEQGPFYCSVGTNKCLGREISEAHYRACLYAGVKIAGTNAEVMPSQWEYQIGICHGIEIGDHMWVARFILNRIAEDFDACIDYDPKPLSAWNGSGCHTNFSTNSMREENGITDIAKAIEKLKGCHAVHMVEYDLNEGVDNQRRLSGQCETAHYSTFSSGIANRYASVRIPRHCEVDKKGYLEDRRPAGNCDPYRVASIIVQSVILN